MSTDMSDTSRTSADLPPLSPELLALQDDVDIEIRRFSGPKSYVGAMTPLRVAHLTDVHIGMMTPYRIHEAAAALTNAHEPDLVVITGDFVCYTQKYLEQVTDFIRRFNAPVFGVLGNHDYWSGADEVRNALRRGGCELLDNRNTTITLRHQPLQLVGLDDAYTGHAHREDALRGMRTDIPTLGLSHIGEEADAMWAAGIPFVLSGHTHGGQITVARMHELAVGKLGGHKYVHGLYGSREEPQPKGAVYVGAGLGTSVMPLRIGDRGQREITIFELGVAPGAFDEHHEEQAPLPGRPPKRTLEERRADFENKRGRARFLRTRPKKEKS